MKCKTSVALIGAGSMGGALLRGWLSDGILACDRSAVFDPAAPDWVRAAATEHGFALNPPIGAGVFDIVALAVKPQAAAAILPQFASIAAAATVVSIMAGPTIASIRRDIGGAAKIVRAMPNLPSAIGQGATALYAAPAVDEAGKAQAELLMRSVGATIWVDSEAAIDAVTAVSGSGPAYFFLLAEALEQAARGVGLDERAAATLARATLAGAGAYAARDARALDELRRAVTSPGGTTEAALNILDGDDTAIRILMKKAVAAARKRASELSG